jgi:phage terminase large subunit GpA-like protein
MAPQAGWRKLATQWLEAQKAKAAGNVDLLKRFINNVMAEPWDDLTGATHDQDSLMSQRVPYVAEVPDDVVVITAGVDTQSNKEGLKGGDADEIASREVTIVGWNRYKMLRVICHKVVVGEPGDPRADAELDDILMREYRKRDGTPVPVLPVDGKAIDMGGHYGDQTKAFARQRMRKNVWAVKGRNITLGTRSASVWPKKVSRNPKAGTSWYMIDTQLAKDAVARMLKVKGPGGPMFPMSLGPDYFEGLAAEALVVDKQGRRFWRRKSSTNTGEQWDCLVYAYAALCGLQASFAKWRDLNVAASRMGIAELPPHDPETGELLDAYKGPDHSIGAATQDSPPTAAPSAKDSSNAQKAESTAAPTPTGAVKRKKSRAMRVIRSTRW